MKNNIVKAELMRIAREHRGKLIPEDVVREARPRTSPLHGKFQWDDGKAAHEYRLWQARELITIVVERIEGSAEPTPVFVSLTSDRSKRKGGYRLMTDVMAVESGRSQLLAQAFTDMQRFRQKYAVLRELAGVFKAMDSIKLKRVA